MPEAVEVKKYAEFIKKKMLHKNITEIIILKGRYKKHKPFAGYRELINLLPLKVINVKTKGKLLYIELENNTYIAITLGLAGGFLFKSKNKIYFPKIFSDDEIMIDVGEKYDITKFKNNALNHLNVEFKTKTGAIYFHDTLSYGTINIYFDKQVLNEKLSKLGPDIMDLNTTFEIFKERISKNLNKYIGNVLVNQKIISGIGNYLRSEILWLVKISPFRLIKDLKPSELKNIYEGARHLMWSDLNKKYGLKHNLVLEKFISPHDYGLIFFVYMQEYDIYGNKVIKKELYEGSVKRSIYYVKKIQK